MYYYLYKIISEREREREMFHSGYLSFGYTVFA
jgi:hypothetical protein